VPNLGIYFVGKNSKIISTTRKRDTGSALHTNYVVYRAHPSSVECTTARMMHGLNGLCLSLRETNT